MFAYMELVKSGWLWTKKWLARAVYFEDHRWSVQKKLDPDEVPQNVGPPLRSKLFGSHILHVRRETKGVDSVSHFITVIEISQSNGDCIFHSSIVFLLPYDHITRINLYLLKQALSACVAVVRSRTFFVLRAVIYTVWSYGIILCTVMRIIKLNLFPVPVRYR